MSQMLVGMLVLEKKMCTLSKRSHKNVVSRQHKTRMKVKALTVIVTDFEHFCPSEGPGFGVPDSFS